MKNLLIILSSALLCIACKPEPQLTELESTQSMQKNAEKVVQNTKEHIAEVRLTVPDSTWNIEIKNVLQGDNQIAIYCQLSSSNMMGLMVISEVVDAVKFSAKDLPIKYYIQGKKWNWENNEGYTFVNTENQILIANGESIAFESTEPSAKSGPQRKPIGSPL